jgi:predicted MPP superfamily phosphohydrolase
VFNFPFWLFLLTIIELFPYLVSIDLTEIVAKLALQQFSERIQHWGNLIRVILVPCILIFVIIKSLSDTYGIRISEYHIQNSANADSQQHLTVGLIADLQVDRYTQDTKINKVINAINQDAPDILFFAGDLVTRGKTFIDQGIDAMCDLHAGTARIACIGDHDIWSDPIYISRKLKECAWTVLQDAHTIITHNERRIVITGITYAYSQRISRVRLEQLLKFAPKGDLKILLVHQPAKMVLQAAGEYGYDMLLAGHTHGGQIMFRPFGLTLTPTQVENDIFAGHTVLDSLNVFVTNGIGLTMMPLRYRAAAEIVKIRISY